MAVTERDLVRAVSEGLASMQDTVKAELSAHVEAAIEAHRRRMWVRETWCCEEMQRFAAEVWSAPNPPRRDETTFGGVTLQLRGATVNYCPFCGVRVGILEAR